MNTRKIILSLAENWPAKVLSVALALILFVFHEMSTLTTRTITVPLTVETNSVLVPGSDYPEKVMVKLRGESESIKAINDSDIEAYLDLSKYETEGKYRAPVQIRKKESALLPEPLEITVNPLDVLVDLDTQTNRTLPLAANIKGNVANGFELVSYSLSPDEITVSGPLRIMEALNEIKTDSIDLEGRKSDFSVMVNIANPKPLLLSIRGDAYAEFRCVIRPSVPVRNIDGIAIEITGLDIHLESDLGGKTGSVRLEASQALLDNFTVGPGFLSVDCSGITGPGTYNLPVNVDLPGGFILIRLEPDEVSLTITLGSRE